MSWYKIDYVVGRSIKHTSIFSESERVARNVSGLHNIVAVEKEY